MRLREQGPGQREERRQQRWRQQQQQGRQSRLGPRPTERA